MGYFVYIIQSEDNTTYYKGSTANPLKRLEEHNSGLSRYTSRKTLWHMVYLTELPTKREALIEERRIKHLNGASMLKLIHSESNIIDQMNLNPNLTQ
jgi:putative endonuclease